MVRPTAAEINAILDNLLGGAGARLDGTISNSVDKVSRPAETGHISGLAAELASLADHVLNAHLLHIANVISGPKLSQHTIHSGGN